MVSLEALEVNPDQCAIELEASICRDSFYEFVQRFWDVIIAETPVWNWHIKALCDELQEAAERVFRGEPKLHDIVINIPPGSTKSTICSVMFPAWVWTRMPSARSICASYAYHLAMDLSRRSRDIIKSDKWLKLFGHVELKEDQDAKGYFVNQHDGFRYAVGTGGSVTGFHGHFLIIDDPLDPGQSVSDVLLKTANRWLGETFGTRKVDKSVTVTILIMQRLHQNDPSAIMLEKAKKSGVPIRHINFPAEVSGRGTDVVRPRKYARNYKEGLLDSVRLSRKILNEQKVTLGEYGYAAQFLLHPVSREGGLFKIDRFILETASPHPSMFRSVVRYWDKAGTKDGGAYTAGVLIGVSKDGHFWVLHVVRGQWDSSTREKIIKQTAETDRALWKKIYEVGVEQEPGSGGKESAENTVRSLAGFRVRVTRPTGAKELRADPYSTQVNGGNVHVVVGPWTGAYVEELQFFPNGTFMDQVDASSGAFTLLTRPVIRVGGSDILNN